MLKGKTLRGQFRFGKLIKRNEDDNKENKEGKDNIMLGSIDKQLSNIPLSNLEAKETNGLVPNEDVFNIEVEDNEHHIEKMNIGDTISPKMN